jgi:hypothetical protein
MRLAGCHATVSALPLSRRVQPGHAYYMKETRHHSQGAPQPMRTLRSLVSRTAAVISECNYAQTRLLDLSMTPDRYASGQNRLAS